MVGLVWFQCFTDVFTLVGYLHPKPALKKDSTGTIKP